MFDFKNPHLYDFLFSYGKGWFLWSPAIGLFLLVGIIAFFKRSIFQGFLFLLPISVAVFVFSSWWNWWYGGSFSSRVLVEFLPFFALGLATLLGDFRSLVRKLSRVLIVVLIVVCQIQIYQYRYYQIHWEEMTSERYWNVFLRPDLK